MKKFITLFVLSFILFGFAKIFAQQGQGPQMAPEVRKRLVAAQAAMQEQDFEDALDEINKALEFDPRSGYAFLFRGIVHLQMNEFKKAEEDCLNAIGELPDDPSAYYYLGIAQQAQYKYDVAIKNFQKAIELEDRFLQSYFSLAAIFNDQYKMQKAIDLIDKAILKIKEDEDSEEIAQPYIFKGNIYLQNYEYNKALAEFEQAIAKFPDNESVYLARANAFLRMNMIDSAQNDFNKAFDINNESIRLYLSRPRLLAQQQEFELALYDLDKAIYMAEEGSVGDNTRLTAYSTKALIYATIEDFENAEKAMAEVRKLDPIGFDADLIESQILLMKKSYAEAVVLLEKCNNIKQRDISLLTGIAECKYKLGLTDEANDLVAQSFGIKFEVPTSLALKGHFLAAEGEIEPAKQFIKDALDINPYSENSHFRGAIVHVFAGENDKALEMLEKCLSLDPNMKFKIKDEEDLKPLYNNPKFQELIK